MIYLILGIFLILIQFLPVLSSEDKKRGFIYNVFFWIIFQSLLAVLTQIFGLFYFWVIFSVNFLASLFIFLYYYKKIQWKRLKYLKIDWILIFIIFVSILTLYQVHYNYTGKINYATDQSVIYHDVKNMNYPYPYFSDEWDAISLVNYSIDNHALPIVNPLNGTIFSNFAIPFFSFLSGINLFFGINALYSFNFFAIFINTLIIVLCYLFLIKNGLGWKASSISALSILYITSSANLPGVWHMIPMHLGVVFSLIGFYFMSEDQTKYAIFCGLAVFLFYPPIILFYGLALLVFLLSRIKLNKKNVKKIFIYGSLGIVLLIALTYFLFLLPSFYPKAGPIVKMIFDRFYYKSFSGNLIPIYNFYDVLPILSILFFIFGIIEVYRNYKWLFSQIVLGFSFWLLYSFLTYRIIIDFERIVFFTALIVVIFFAFGIKKTFEYIDSKYDWSKYVTVGFFVFFIFFIPFYTSRDNWKKFIFIDRLSQVSASTKSPANRYITQEDINLFKNIKQKKFLSIPWKGLVIGVATNNIPLTAKDGIISTGMSQVIGEFLGGDCEKKVSVAKKYNLDYIYLYQFDCSEFKKLGESKEGFFLYKFR